MSVVAPELEIIAGGPVLTEGEPSSEADRMIRSDKDLCRSLTAFEIEGVSIVTIRTDDADFMRSCVRRAHERGQRVTLRSSLPVEHILDSGVDVLAGAHQMLNTFRQASSDSKQPSPLEVLDVPNDVKAREAARRIADSGVAVTTGLLSLRRASFPKEALDAPYLEDLMPIFPHSRHLLAAIGSFSDTGGVVLPASFAPGFGVVPGYSIKEEVTLLAHVYGSIDLALSQATGEARKLFRTVSPAPTDVRHLEAPASDYGLDLALSLSATSAPLR